MEWLFILALAAVAAWQGVRLGALTKRVAELEQELAARAAESLWAPPAPARAAEPAAAQPPAPAPQDDALLLDQPLPPDEREPLLLDQPLAEDELVLDTPLPEPSNDTAPPPREAPYAPPVARPGRLARALDALRRPADFRFDRWLAEKDRAWLVVGAVALGAILLVLLATQQRWFSPQVQLVLALLLGFSLSLAGEWERRVALQPPGHPLAAALLAGAGVAVLYATAWAGHELYGLIDYPIAAALLALCALVLIGLSFLHGQVIGMLAILAALLAPGLMHQALWPAATLTLYIASAGATGLTLAALRRWGWVAVATLAGLYFWFWVAVGADEFRRALALISFASFGCVALALRPPLPAESEDALSWRRVHALGPTLGVAISSVFLIFVWAAIAPTVSGSVAGPALISVFHIALAAYAVRGHVAQPVALMVAVLGLVGGCVAYLQVRYLVGPLGADFYPVMLTAALATVICAVGAHPHRRWRTGMAAAGAIGAALLIVLTVFSRDVWNALDVWAPLFGGALLLFAAAWRASRDMAPTRSERVIDFWAGAAAALILLGVESAFPAEARAAAHAGAALMFASAFAWRGWRAFGFAALAAAGVAIAHALAPALIGAALAGEIPIWGALMVLAVAAAFLFGAARYFHAGSTPLFGEALSVGGAATILIGVALLLRWFGVHEVIAYAIAVIGAGFFVRWRAPRVHALTFAPLTAGAVGVAHALVDWLSRAYRAGQRPDDLVDITPGARRERRYGRRQRSP